MQEFQNRDPFTGTYIEKFERSLILLVQQPLYGDNVRLGKIDHIDVVANATAIRRIVVVPEYLQLLPDPGSSLGNKRYQVVGNAIGQFSDQGR